MLKRKTNSNNKSEINNARILYYDFFAGLFIYDLLLNRTDVILDTIKILNQFPIQDSSLPCYEVLFDELRDNGVKNLIHEYTYTFMLPFNPNVVPTPKNKADKIKQKNKQGNTSNNSTMLYLSYYIDGSVAGEGLRVAKDKVRKSKYRLNETNFKENEEHFGFLMLFMKTLLQNNENNLSTEVFKDCIKPMYEQICSSLMSRDKGSLYYNVAVILRDFLDFESNLFKS